MRNTRRTGALRYASRLFTGLAVGLIAALFAVTVPSLTVAQPPSSGNGAKRFDDLRELNNKLDRAIKHIRDELVGSVFPDLGKLRRTLQDLEVTKLRAVDQFPPVFGVPYGETFRQLSCIDDQVAVSRRMLDLLEGPPALRLLGGWLTNRGHHYLKQVVLNALKRARSCKDTLEGELASATGVPAGVSDDLRELNNKLDRAIKHVRDELVGSVFPDLGKLRRTLTDLEVTKLRAVDQFPEVLDPPYGETFRQLSCIDDEIAVSRKMLDLLEGPPALRLLGGWLTNRGDHYAKQVVLNALKRAKSCKDTAEIELMHSFDLKPSEQTQDGVKATTPNGTDTQNPKKLNAPKSLQTAYARDGFVGRHDRDYVALGVNGGNPESWPQGQNVLFFDVFDLFGSAKGARKANQASQQNLKSNAFSLVSDSSLGSGETVFQKQAAGSPLLSTVIYVQRGTFIMKVAASCKGCSRGSVESSLKSLAQTQLARAVVNGFPGSKGSGSGGSGGSSSCSGDANLSVTLDSSSGQTHTAGQWLYYFPSAIPASCNIGIRSSSQTGAKNYSQDSHDGSNASVIYDCHDGPPGPPPGEAACPGSNAQPSPFAGGSLYTDIFKASDGTWQISMEVFTRQQSFSVPVRVHYAWTPCTGSSC